MASNAAGKMDPAVIGEDGQVVLDRRVELVRLVGDPGEEQVGPAGRHGQIVPLRKRQQMCGHGVALVEVAGLPVDQHQELQHADRSGVDPFGLTLRASGQPADGLVGLPGGLQGQSQARMGKAVREPAIGREALERAARDGDGGGGILLDRQSVPRESTSISPRIASTSRVDIPARQQGLRLRQDRAQRDRRPLRGAT